MISKELIKFLANLKQNNNRDWFNKRKLVFKEHETEVKAFFKEVENLLQVTDSIESHSVFRIYRDVRFSKDKSPYKSRFAGYFKREKPLLRGGYYLVIEPVKSMAGGGFYGPNPDDLKRIRKEFEQDDSEIRAILNNKKFKIMFGALQGDEVKSAPRGFDVNHKAIDLIKKKQFYVSRTFSDKEVISADFANQVKETYNTLRPYFDYMSAVLTTNINGESVVD